MTEPTVSPPPVPGTVSLMTQVSPAQAPSDAVRPLPPADDRLRRLQIGIAGLVGILLLVGLAGIISDRANPDPAVVAGESATFTTGEDAPTEPLAELGVQPTAPDDAATTQQPTSDQTVVDGKGPVPDLKPDPVLQRARDAAKK